MMISVITPTHNVRWLSETWKSLQAQSYQGEWEWLIVPNNGASVEIDDPRVRVVPCNGIETIGGLKRFCCEQAQGDIIIELDHDDMLTPHALNAIAEGLFNADFVYSNFAEFKNKSWEPSTYDFSYGWRYREREFYGRQFVEQIAFGPSAASMSIVWYAPNHVRAWKKDTYWSIGGHDPKMKVADDHDLCCRFYLDGQVAHIDDLLYLYRRHGDNSYLTHNAEVQTTTKQVRDKYIWKLIERWAGLGGLKMVDLGSAHNKPQGYIGVDLYEGAGVDVVHDVTTGLPFEDDSVGVIRAVDFLEHLPIGQVVPFMNEAYRVLIDGGWLISATPSTDGRGAYQDPTHVSFWNQNSFWYYTRRAQAQFVPQIKCKFQAMRIVTQFPTDWHRNNDISYVYADLVAVKSEKRRPGQRLL